MATLEGIRLEKLFDRVAVFLILSRSPGSESERAGYLSEETYGSTTRQGKRGCVVFQFCH
jgi:hypothetical protein